MIKEMKQSGKYFIIRNDDPYIEKLYEVLKRGLGSKGGRHGETYSFREGNKPEATKLRA
ncbi:MAG TPA: hypothetical protein VLZ07_08015 [Syntrophales bacterium]|nr:hypothetical protein [Syntrophales bacterium]